MKANIVSCWLILLADFHYKDMVPDSQVQFMISVFARELHPPPDGGAPHKWQSQRRTRGVVDAKIEQHPPHGRDDHERGDRTAFQLEGRDAARINFLVRQVSRTEQTAKSDNS